MGLPWFLSEPNLVVKDTGFIHENVGTRVEIIERWCQRYTKGRFQVPIYFELEEDAQAFAEFFGGYVVRFYPKPPAV